MAPSIFKHIQFYHFFLHTFFRKSFVFLSKRSKKLSFAGETHFRLGEEGHIKIVLQLDEHQQQILFSQQNRKTNTEEK